MDPLKKPEPSTDIEDKKPSEAADTPADAGMTTDSAAPMPSDTPDAEAPKEAVADTPSDTPSGSADTSPAAEAPESDVPTAPSTASDTPSGAPDVPEVASDKPAEADSGSDNGPADEPKPAGVPAPASEAPAATPSWSPEPSAPAADTAAAPAEDTHISAPDSLPPATPEAATVGAGAVAGVTAASVAGSKRMRVIAIVTAVIVLLLLACGASALYYVMNKPQNVLDMALSNEFSDKAKSATFSGEAVVTDKDKRQTLNATFSGAASQDGALTVSAKADVTITNVTVDVRSTDGQSFFVKVGGLAGLPQLLGSTDPGELRALAAITKTVNDQWLEINQSMIKELTGSSLSTKLSEGDRSKIEAAYKQHRFLVVKQTLVDQTVASVPSHHYRVGVDKAKLKDFYGALKAANLDGLKITGDDQTAFNKSLDGSGIDKYLVDVWIGRSDRLIRRIGYKTTTGSGAVFTLTLTVDAYNKPVNVEKPTGAKSILEVLGQLYGGSMSMEDMQNMGGSPLTLPGISL